MINPEFVINTADNIHPIESHPNILKIKEVFAHTDCFHFNFITLYTIITEIKNLNLSKAIPKETLPVKILKDNINIFPHVLFNNFNNCIAFDQFPYKLKFADIAPVFKKGCKADKSNYRPVSILPVRD